MIVFCSCGTAAKSYETYFEHLAANRAHQPGKAAILFEPESALERYNKVRVTYCRCLPRGAGEDAWLRNPYCTTHPPERKEVERVPWYDPWRPHFEVVCEHCSMFWSQHAGVDRRCLFGPTKFYAKQPAMRVAEYNEFGTPRVEPPTWYANWNANGDVFYGPDRLVAAEPPDELTALWLPPRVRDEIRVQANWFETYALPGRSLVNTNSLRPVWAAMNMP